VGIESQVYKPTALPESSLVQWSHLNNANTGALLRAVFQLHLQNTGTLWEGRYQATLIDNEIDALTCRYIELFPVRAKMVAHPASHALGEVNDLIVCHELY
jgi:hypothetical protein